MTEIQSPPPAAKAASCSLEDVMVALNFQYHFKAENPVARLEAIEYCASEVARLAKLFRTELKSDESGVVR